MPRTHPLYPREFRHQTAELFRGHYGDPETLVLATQVGGDPELAETDACVTEEGLPRRRVTMNLRR